MRVRIDRVEGHKKLFANVGDDEDHAAFQIMAELNVQVHKWLGGDGPFFINFK